MGRVLGNLYSVISVCHIGRLEEVHIAIAYCMDYFWLDRHLYDAPYKKHMQ